MSHETPKVPPKPCSCLGDRFAALPPELRPKQPKADGLRHVVCPGCGQRFWTNRSADLCMECERNGKQPPVQSGCTETEES